MRTNGININVILIFILILFISSWSYTQSNLPSGFGGVGMQITMQNGNLLIVSILPDSPAERIGLKSGDLITQINGELASNMKLEEIINQIRGPEGTGIKFNIKRPGTEIDQEIEFNVNREFILIPTSGNSGTPEKLADREYRQMIQGGTSVYPILYFVPLTLQVSPNQPFLINIFLNNSQGLLADELGLWIQYDPKSIIILSSDLTEIIDLKNKIFEGWSLTTSFTSSPTGDLYLELKNPSPGIPLNGVIGKILMESTGLLPVTQVQFKFGVSGKSPGTFLNYRTKDILGSKSDPIDGTISSTIRTFKP